MLFNQTMVKRTQRKKSSITIGEIIDKTEELEEEDDMLTMNARLNVERSYLIIFPDSNLRFVWDLLSFCFILYQAIVLPYKISFEFVIPSWMIIFDAI